MKKLFKMQVLVGLAFLGTGLLSTGCKSAPPLTQSDAQGLIQADYDHKPAAGAGVLIDDLGLKQGLTAKYWKLSKVYPNNKWADYTLTDDGKKVLTLQSGGDVIQWRPDIGAASPHFYVITVAVNHFKVKDVQDESATAKSAIFSESLDLTGVPAALVDIAHNPGNRLSSKKTAHFALADGAWKLDSIN